MINASTHIVKDFTQFLRLQDYVLRLNPNIMVLDTETDSKIEKIAKLYGIGICFTDTTAFYIPWKKQTGELWWSDEQMKAIIGWLYNTASKTNLIGHNIIYDILVLENNMNIDLTDFVYSDTILQHHTLNEEPPHGLKEIAVKLLGNWADKAQKEMKDSVLLNGGKYTEEQKDMYLADTDILANYCIWDVLLTYKLFRIFEPQLIKEDLMKLFYEEEIMPLYKEVAINMKRKGFPVDLEHFNKLKKEIKIEIDKIEEEILSDVKQEIEPFIQDLLDKNFPMKTGGLFPKVIAEIYNVPIPLAKRKDKETGENYMSETLSSKALTKQRELTPEFAWFYDWVTSNGEVISDKIYNVKREVQEKLFFKKRESAGKYSKYIFNLSSGPHLAYLLYTALGIKCEHWTDGGKSGTPKPSTKAAVIDEIIEKYASKNLYLPKLLDYRKLSKLQSTYILGILKRQIDGVIYTSYLLHGTTSGRFASRSPNLQNLPAVKEDGDLSPIVLKYTNAIRKGFKAPKGFKVINADFSRLEVVCFADTSGDPLLIESLRNGEDLYSAVAIQVEGLKEYSAKESDDNYLKKHKPAIRQKWKVPPLGIVYGMGEGRLMESIGCDYEEAKSIITRYLSTYPDLKKYMKRCEYQVKTSGFIKTEFGRIRHLPRAKQLYTKYGNDILNYKWAKQRNLLTERRELKNLLNNAKNFPIQGKAAHLVNRAAIAINRAFKDKNIDCCVRLNTHDELTCIAREDQAELVAAIMQDMMENTTKISIPLNAKPLIADNWADAK